MNNKYFEPCVIPVENDFIITGTTTDVTDYNGTDGSVDVGIIGGTGPYTYSWSNGLTTQDISGVPAGTYTVTVIDSEGLQATTSFTVGQPFPISCFATPTPVSQNGLSDGSIEIIGIGGGTGPYTVTVEGPAPSTATQTQTVTAPNTTASFNGLSTGDYTTTVTDSSAVPQVCEQTGVTITTPPPLVISATTTNVSCFGGSNGTLSVNYVTGVPPVNFTITSPNGFSATTTTNISLDDGVYTINAEDSIGQTVTEVVVITEPSDITLSTPTTVNNVSCNGAGDGSISVGTPSGGNGAPYTFSWDGPTPNPITTSSPILSNIGTTARPVGEYTVTITDNTNNCETFFTYEVVEPPVLSISLGSKTNVTCNGGNDGSITVSASGGNPALTPSNGNYTYQIISPSNIGPQASPTFNGLAADTYTIVVSDVNSCPSSPINVTLSEPTVVTVNVISKTSTSINLSASGGNGGPFTYYYKLTTSTNYTSTTSPLISGLQPSTSYDIFLTDSEGCESSVITVTTN
jgi:hypothetical protein